MKRGCFYYIIICITLTSCADFSRKVEKYLSVNYAKTEWSSTQIMDLQEVLNVSIDEVYVFPELTSHEEISEIIGVSLPSRETSWSWDQKWHLLCLYKGQVAYEEVYKQMNIFFTGNDTLWNFEQSFIDKWNHTGVIPPSTCEYKVFRSPLFMIRKLRNEKLKKYDYFLFQSTD